MDVAVYGARYWIGAGSEAVAEITDAILREDRNSNLTAYATASNDGCQDSEAAEEGEDIQSQSSHAP